MFTLVVGSFVVLTTLVPAADAGRSLALVQAKPAVEASAPSDAAAIRQRVKVGQKVRITDDQGREWEGRVGEFTPDTLVLVTRDRQQRAVPYGAILRIDRPHDGLGNGAVIGFLSGAVVGLLAVISEEANDCDPAAFFGCSDPTAGAYVVAPLLVGGVGAGIGVGIDALIRKEANLFRRGNARVSLAPALGAGFRSLRVSVRW